MKRLSGSDQAWLWEELSYAIRREQPLPNALRELGQANAGTRRGSMALSLADVLASGASLPQAVKRAEDFFAPGVAAALETGERSGRLPELFSALSESARLESSMRSIIARVLIYPVVLAVGALAVICFIQFGILPEFDQIWKDLDMETGFMTHPLPLLLQVEACALLLIPALVLIIVYLVPRRLLPFRKYVDGLRMKLPLVGGVVRKLQLLRWCESMAMLIAAGVPEPEAVRLVGRSAGNARVEAISQELGERIERGMSLSEGMRNESFFPEPLKWMVASAEAAGGHARVWPVARDMYRTQANRSSYIVSVILQICFVLLACQVVGATIIGVFAPLIRLMNSLG